MSHGHDNVEVPPPDTSRGFEYTDADPRAILIFSISLVVTLAVTTLIAIALYGMFQEHADSSNAAEYAPSPMATLRSPPASPPLQPSKGHETLPYQDSELLKAAYAQLAGTYGSELMADNAVHNRMPVEAAFQLLMTEGLPHDTATDIPTPQGNGPSMATPYGTGGRGLPTGVAAQPGAPQTPPGQ